VSLAASPDAFLTLSSEFLNSTNASSRSARNAAKSVSNLRFCEAKLLLAALNSLIRSAASCKSLSSALRFLSACSNKVRF
jgi:hypothetical protein